MEHLILVKVMVQPALHIVTMDRREYDARPGMMWAFLAAAGSSGRLRVQVCIDCTLSPFGRWATRGTVAAQMFVTGALVVRKWLVAPKLRIVHRLMVSALVEIVLRSTAAAKA
jgi:hypothetical protein